MERMEKNATEMERKWKKWKCLRTTHSVLLVLSIELFDTKSNKSIWSDNWMEDWDSLPKIKNNLVDNILKIFSNKNLDSTNIDNDLIRSSSNAYEQYLKAKYILKTRSNEKDYKKLEEILNALITSDKNFIAPYLLFGDYYLAIAKYYIKFTSAQKKIKYIKKFKIYYKIAQKL